MGKREFQPILLENLRIRWPGFGVRRIALNQHMPRVERLDEHVHRFSQLLLYLRGEGVQHLGDRTVPVGRGSVLFVPPRQAHRFAKTRSVRPICLALDLDTLEPAAWRESAVLASGDLARIERWLVRLHALQRNPDPFSLQSAALILRLLARLEAVVSAGASRGADEGGPVAAKIRKLAAARGFPGLTPGGVAAEMGRSLDHLNRSLRAEGGTTVGGLLDRLRLDAATRALREGDRPVGEVASSVGMDDQNYFARWFRRQTGQTPTRWRAAMRG
jgi:AraC family transcriptional activator of pobA